MTGVILDLCGGTGAWSAPYAAAGYEVRVIDPRRGTGTVQEFWEKREEIEVRGILAAPPCTEFAGSGARWWKTKPSHLLAEAIEIVECCLDIISHYNPAWWALENPVGRIPKLFPEVLGEPRLRFDPCDYGDPWTKRTCIWGDFKKPELSYTPPKKGSISHYFPDVAYRAHFLSITPPGFAKAFFEANP